MRTKRLTSNVFFYFLGTFSTKILQILFIPLYSTYIETSGYGYYNLVLSLITLTIPLLYQSIWEGVLRFIIDKEGQERKILSSTSIYCGGLTLIYSAIFLIFSRIFDIKYGTSIMFMALGQMSASYWQFSARALKENRIFTLSTVISSITTITVNIIMILVLKWDVHALFIANIAGNFAMVLVLESRLKLIKGIKISLFDKEIIKIIVRYSLPLCINAVSWWLISSSNSLVISYKLGTNANGIYSMAVRFGSVMTLLTSVVNMAWLEESFRTYGHKESDEYFNLVLNMLIRVVLSGVALLIPITFIFYQFFVYGDYKSGVYLTPIIFLNAAYTAFASHLGSGFLARKESGIIFWTTLISGLVSAIGGYMLADSFGLMGVVVTSLIGTILMFSMRVPMLIKRMKLSINCPIIIGLTILSVLLLFVCNYKPDSFIYQIIILLVTGIAILFINKNFIFFIFDKVKSMISKVNKNEC